VATSSSTSPASPADSPILGVAARYAGDAAEDYWRYQEPIGRESARRDRWKVTPHVASDDRLVEFGCGGGFMLEQLPVAERLGIEVNPGPRAAGLSRGLDVRDSLDAVEDGWADVVWSHHVLEHVLAPFTVLEGMHRILRPGGRLVLCLPIDDWRSEIDATGPDVNGHLWTWTPLLMHNLLSEAGFADVRTSVVPYSWPRGSRLLVRWPRAYRAAASLAGRLRRSRELHVVARRA
jgi:SAM-dependent methyltransferase